MSALTDTVSADMPFTPERGHVLNASWSKWHFNQCPRAFTIYWHYKQYFKEWNVCLRGSRFWSLLIRAWDVSRSRSSFAV